MAHPTTTKKKILSQEAHSEAGDQGEAIKVAQEVEVPPDEKGGTQGEGASNSSLVAPIPLHYTFSKCNES